MAEEAEGGGFLMELVTEATNEAFWTGVYVAVIFLIPVALWSFVCHVLNRSIS